MGLYAMWALRDEVAAVADPALLPGKPEQRLRLEDLLGFRRNPITATPLFREFGARALDGHPTPATPFVKLATGASGVGVASSIGLAIGAADRYGPDAPRVHIVEGEGGLTPGRVSEALAAAGTASLANVIVHLDWNQASIDSDRVCRDGAVPGDYVQWDPRELFYLHDWNVVDVPDGHDFQQVVAAQRHALALHTGQPTAIVYHTQQGLALRRGGQGQPRRRAQALLRGLLRGARGALPHHRRRDRAADLRPGGPRLRRRGRPRRPRALLLDGAAGDPRAAAPGPADGGRAGGAARGGPRPPRGARPGPPARRPARRRRLRARRGDGGGRAGGGGHSRGAAPRAGHASPRLRGELGRALHQLQAASGGAFLVAAADLAGSTSVTAVTGGSPGGFWNANANIDARLLSVGGICEDAIAGVLSGIAAYGHDLGVGSSYGAFMAPLGHIAARLHAIGSQARASVTGEPYKPIFLVCAHAGLETGEDGPTHADPQPLQLLQEDFPKGTAVSLVPWEPQEIWTLTAAALAQRPAVISAFVTRPNEPVLDRPALGLAPAEAAVTGVYRLRDSEVPDVTVVLQESAVTYAFVREALPMLEEKGVDALVYYVASAELFDLLGRGRAARDPAGGARRRGHRHHRLHPADALSLGDRGGRPVREPVPLQEGPLSGQRAGRSGARRSRPRRREPGGGDPALLRQTRRRPMTSAAGGGRDGRPPQAGLGHTKRLEER